MGSLLLRTALIVPAARDAVKYNLQNFSFLGKKDYALRRRKTAPRLFRNI